VGRIGSGVRVSASFQIFASIMLLHSTCPGLPPGRMFSRGMPMPNLREGMYPANVSHAVGKGVLKKWTIKEWTQFL